MKKLFRDCLTIAQSENTPDKHPEWGCYHHWSFLVQKSKILGWATNTKGARWDIRTLGYEDWSKAHSEVNVWIKWNFKLDKDKAYDVVNIRLNKDSDLMLSCPCPCCNQFLVGVGVRNIYFTTECGFAKIT